MENVMNLVIQKVKDKQYVSFRESYWDPLKKRYSSRTIKNFGRLDLLQKDNPNILEELRAQVAQAKVLSDDKKEQIIKQRVDELRTVKNSSNYKDSSSTCLGLSVYWQIWDQLGFQKQFFQFWKRSGIRFDLPKAVFFLLTAKALFPDSKLSFWLKRNQFLFGVRNLSLNSLYRAIYHLVKKEKFVLRHLNKENEQASERKVTVVLYDLTNDYVGNQERLNVQNEDLSKDKLDMDKVVLALIMDEQGIPIDYEVCPCYPSGFVSVSPLMTKIQNQYTIERVVVTADLGLNNKNVIKVFRVLNISYVCFYEVRNAPASIRNLIRNKRGWDHEKVDVQQDYYDVKKYRITRGTLWENSEEQSNDQKGFSNLLIHYSAKRVRKDKEDRLRLTPGEQIFLDFPKKERLVRKSYRMRIKNSGKRGEEVYDGYRGIAFSDPNLSARQVIEIYCSLRKLKQFFRASAILEGSHWKEKRVKAHILISFLALTMQRYLEWRLKEGIESLKRNYY